LNLFLPLYYLPSISFFSPTSLHFTFFGLIFFSFPFLSPKILFSQFRYSFYVFCCRGGGGGGTGA
jgi:hypothetical protein